MRLVTVQCRTRHKVIGGTNSSRLSARCGRTPNWGDPRGWRIADDGSPLRKCRRCTELEAADAAP